jgi:hypothetical protein
MYVAHHLRQWARVQTEKNKVMKWQKEGVRGVIED